MCAGTSRAAADGCATPTARRYSIRARARNRRPPAAARGAQRPRSAQGRTENAVEEYFERSERLTPPLGPEAEKHDMTVVELHVQCRRLAIQVFFADEVARQQRRRRILIFRQHDTLEAFLRLEHRAAVGEHRR